MASLHTGSPNMNSSVELLCIETNIFTVYIKGKPFHPTVETLQLHRNTDNSWVPSHFNVTTADTYITIKQMKLFSTETGKLEIWNTGQKNHPLFYETQSYEFIVEKKGDISLAFHHSNVNVRNAVKPLGKSILAGVLNFQNEVGFTELELRMNGIIIFTIQLEIFPAKLDYKQDYQQILHEVNEQIYNLSFDFLRRTFQLTGLVETRSQSLSEFFAILQQVFGQLVHAVERISLSPHYKLQKEYSVRDIDRIKKSGRENISFLRRNPNLLHKNERLGIVTINDERYLPTRALETKKHVNYDTVENRFVRWVLLRIDQKLKDLVFRLAGKDRKQDPYLAQKISHMQQQIQRFLNREFLRVGEMRQLSITLVLQMGPGYRDVLRYYLMLMKGLNIQSDIFRMSMKDLGQLYEYWCFLKIHHLLSKKYELLQQNMIKVNRTGLFVSLDRSQQAKLEYRNPKNGEIFTLLYNTLPREDSSQTIGQQPDNVLTLKKNDSDVEYKYVFDAKYRINPAYRGTPYQRQYVYPGPEVEDINTMHRYRDAIVYQENSKADFERSMFGAYVLFPYHNEEQYTQHKFYKSIELVNVGAFPFLPNSTSLVEKFLDELIMDSPEKAYERSSRPRGTSTYYKNKFSGKNVLVGALSSKGQLSVALKEKFYHTPLKEIPIHSILSQIEYVGIYQSERFFGKEDSGIFWIGEIADWKVVRRREIDEIESKRGKPDDLYVKFTVSEWERLADPILPGGYYIYRNLFTSKYILDRANEIAELRLDTEEHIKKWREHRRRGKVNLKLNEEYVDLATMVELVEVNEDNS